MKIMVCCTISIKSASYTFEMINQVYDKEHSSYGTLIATRRRFLNPLSKYFGENNDLLKIELNGTLKILGIGKALTGPLSLAQALWKKNGEKDITIEAENQKIKIHKWILCDNSSFFKAELKKSQENIIYITDFSFKTIKTVIEYCYERNINDTINGDTAHELLHFADKYDIKGLKDKLQDILIQKLTVENVCKIANASIISNAHELCEFCICFLMKYVGKNLIIKDVKDLNDEIFKEIGRRCLSIRG